jgi:hypothetical protein
MIISPFGQLGLWAPSSKGARCMMMIISPCGQLGLWAPSSKGARCMMMIISPCGQLGLWAPSSRVRDVFTCLAGDLELLTETTSVTYVP